MEIQVGQVYKTGTERPFIWMEVMEKNDNEWLISPTVPWILHAKQSNRSIYSISDTQFKKDIANGHAIPINQKSADRITNTLRFNGTVSRLEGIE